MGHYVGSSIYQNTYLSCTFDSILEKVHYQKSSIFKLMLICKTNKGLISEIQVLQVLLREKGMDQKVEDTLATTA